VGWEDGELVGTGSVGDGDTTGDRPGSSDEEASAVGDGCGIDADAPADAGVKTDPSGAPVAWPDVAGPALQPEAMTAETMTSTAHRPRICSPSSRRGRRGASCALRRTGRADVTSPPPLKGGRPACFGLTLA